MEEIYIVEFCDTYEGSKPWAIHGRKDKRAACDWAVSCFPEAGTALGRFQEIDDERIVIPVCAGDSQITIYSVPVK